jgi:protoporphyrinogen oxidase
MEPEALSVTQANRRVSASSLGKMIHKVLAAAPGLKPAGSGRFFYPRKGFGQICEQYYHAACRSGATFYFGACVRSIQMDGSSVKTVQFEQDGQSKTVDADYVWSTLPITALIRALRPPASPDIVEAANNLEYRAMILIYLVLETAQFSEYDAHYFPESCIPVTRISEPKNYSSSRQPGNRTVLCAELPCHPSDSVWHMTDEELGHLVCKALESAAIPVRAPVNQVVTRRLRQAYPLYRPGYEVDFARMDQWVNQISNLLTFGRQGLFAHDNTHHALYMAYAAADCFDTLNGFDHRRWQEFRSIFDTHVVED